MANKVLGFINITTAEDRERIKKNNIRKNLEKIKGDQGGVELLDRLSFYPAGPSPGRQPKPS